MKPVLILSTAFLLTLSSAGQKKKLDVLIDEKTELITVTQLLFGYPLVGKADINYKKDVLANFQKYRTDTTVNYLLRVTQNNFSFSKPFLFTYHFSFPQFEQEYPFTASDVQSLNYDDRKEKLLLFNKCLKEFYDKVDFHDFYKKHKPFYRKVTSDVKRRIKKYNLVQVLEKHYGEEQASYSLVLSPLSIEAGYSIWIKGQKGNHLYAIVGPKIDSKSDPVFDTESLVQSLVIHEFSHSFCNPLIEKKLWALERDSCLFDPIKTQLKKQGCEDWRSALNEFFTRANELVLTEKIFGKSASDTLYNKYINQGWVYIQGLIPIIKKYTDDRKTYKTIKDIMPEVVTYFHNEAAKLSGCD